jgi:hypothetical protein
VVAGVDASGEAVAAVVGAALAAMEATLAAGDGAAEPELHATSISVTTSRPDALSLRLTMIPPLLWINGRLRRSCRPGFARHSSRRRQAAPTSLDATLPPSSGPYLGPYTPDGESLRQMVQGSSSGSLRIARGPARCEVPRCGSTSGLAAHSERDACQRELAQRRRPVEPISRPRLMA